MPSTPILSRYSAEAQAYRGKDPASGAAIAPVEPSSEIKLASDSVPPDASKIEKLDQGFEMWPKPQSDS